MAWESSLAQRPRWTTIFSQVGSLSGSTSSVADLPSSLTRSEQVSGPNGVAMPSSLVTMPGLSPLQRQSLEEVHFPAAVERQEDGPSGG